MSQGSLKQAKSFLVVRLGAIGDVLRVCPAVRRLRREFPDAKIGWAVEHWVAPILEANPNVDKLHILNRRDLNAGSLGEFTRFLREIRSEHYDVALDFHGRFKSGIVTRASGARWRLGFPKDQCTENNHWFTNQKVRLEDPLENRVQRFLHLLEPMGISPEFDPADIGVNLSETDRVEAKSWYSETGRPPLAIFAGTSANQAAYHRWPEAKWIDLIQRLNEDGIASVVFWGPDEAELSKRIVHSAGSPCRLAPNTSLVEMMAKLSQFEAFIGGNTAAMHMAWLQGVPTALFTGPAEPRTDSPMPPIPGKALRVKHLVRDGISKRYQANVTEAVSVDEAYAAVLELLQSSATEEGAANGTA